MARDVSLAISMFKKVGLKVVWAQQEDLYMLVPTTQGRKREVHGSAVLSSEVMVGINEHLSGLRPRDIGSSGSKSSGE